MHERTYDAHADHGIEARPANLLPARIPEADDRDRAVVGTILTLINQLDVIVKGNADTFTWVKSVLNYCVPFVVSNLGLLAGKHAEGKTPGVIRVDEPLTASEVSEWV